MGSSCIEGDGPGPHHPLDQFCSGAPGAWEEVQVGGSEGRHHHIPQGPHESMMVVLDPTLASL